MSIVAATLVGVVSTLVIATLTLGALLVERHRVAAVADAAALAAADAAAGLGTGAPCDVADRLAQASVARVSACVREGTSVTVRALSVTSSVPVGATATAGQPAAQSSPGTETSKK